MSDLATPFAVEEGQSERGSGALQTLVGGLEVPHLVATNDEPATTMQQTGCLATCDQPASDLADKSQQNRETGRVLLAKQ